MTNRTVKRPRRKPSARLTDGGNHALNFVNSRRNQRKGPPIDLLTNYETYINWCHDAGLIDWDKCLELGHDALTHELETTHCYGRARAARSTISSIFNDLAAGRDVAQFDIEWLNIYVTRIRQHLRYEAGPDGTVRQSWHNVHEDLDLPFYLIIHATCDLLNNGQWRKIKKCPVCGSLFIDTSRAHNRTWCSPQTCGSIGKSERYYGKLRVA